MLYIKGYTDIIILSELPTFIKVNKKFMDNITKKLVSLGLTSKEASIYTATLELGEASVQEIAQKANQKRSTVYEIIPKLKKQNLVSESIKGKKKFIFAENPNVLQKIHEEKGDILKSITPFLNSIAYSSTIKPQVQFYTDIKQIKELYENTLKSTSREILFIESPESLVNRLGWDWAQKYMEKRTKQRISTRVLVNYFKGVEKYIKEDSKYLRKTRILATENIFPSGVIIYDNTVIFLSANKKEVIGLKLVSDGISRTMKILFNSLWDTAKKIV